MQKFSIALFHSNLPMQKFCIALFRSNLPMQKFSITLFQSIQAISTFRFQEKIPGVQPCETQDLALHGGFYSPAFELLLSSQ
jgi:hypothetical protein